MAPEASGTASKASAQELRMARDVHLYRRFSVDRSTDLANLDEAFEKIRERRTRLENQLLTVLLIAVAAACAALVAAFR
jgi:DNA-binding IclR family transcriptional regulator